LDHVTTAIQPAFELEIFSIHHQIMVYAPSVISLASLVEILIFCPYYQVLQGCTLV
jgi:hypothetical protein